MKNNIKHYLKYGLFVILWLALIWFLSDQANLSLPLPAVWDLLIRKVVHWSIYAVLGLLMVKLIMGQSHWSSRDFNRYLMLLMIFSLGVSYAAVDEIHQSFVVGRVASVFDVIIDSCGFFFGLCWGARLQESRLRHSIKVLLTR